MKFNNFKISTKLTIGFGLIMFLAGLLTLYCWFNLKTLISDYRKNDYQMDLMVLNSENKALLNEYLYQNNLSNLEFIKNNLNQCKKIIGSEIENGDKDEIHIWDKLTELNQTNEKNIEDLNLLVSQLTEKEVFLTTKELELFKLNKNDFENEINNKILNMRLIYKFKSDENAADNYIKTLNSIISTTKNNTETVKLITELTALFDEYKTKNQNIKRKTEEINKGLNEIISYCSSNEMSLKNKSSEVFKSVTISILIITLICALLAVLIAEYIKFELKRGIKKAVSISQSISKGDLTIKIEEKYLNRKDEIGDLIMALNLMLLKLKEIVNNVVSSSENISNASHEMSSNSQQLSQGASEQASSAEEVSSSIQEMSSNIQQNSENAFQTEKIAVKAANEIEEASNNVNITVNAMKEIFSKVSIISDIAFQTNILALNAAVEAARAGEHGKGFAVVASEVRKLAERSQEAATEINDLSKSTLDSAIISGDLLTKLVPDIQHTARLVQDIASGSMEQNTGAEQINSAIQQLNQVIQQNAAASEEMATSSEELEAQSQIMLDLINYFKTGHIVTTKPEKKKTKEKIIFGQKSTVFAPKTTKGFSLNLGKKDDLDNEYERF